MCKCVLTNYTDSPGMAQAVLLVFGVAERAFAAHGVWSWQRNVLLQQHGQDLIVVPVGSQNHWCHVHGGGIFRVLNALHQFLWKQRTEYKVIKTYLVSGH